MVSARIIAACCPAVLRRRPRRDGGEVSTEFKFIGPNHKIVVEAYDDPKVGGVACYLSRAKTGGINGRDRHRRGQGRGVGRLPPGRRDPFQRQLPKQEEVFSERASILFKRVRVVRMVDVKRNALVYLVYSDRLVEGSPQNSVTGGAIAGGRKRFRW